MLKAVISGISGQDGALLGSLLIRKGYEVYGLIPADRNSDLYRLAYLGIDTQIKIRRVDLLDANELTTLLEDVQPDEYYNLAAISSVGYSFHHPQQTFDFNTGSVMNLLESIRQASPKTRLYHASSSEMFGNVGKERLPIKESFLFHPVSPYGISKAAAHWLTVNYREAYRMNACCGILFNHESALRPSGFVIKKLIRKVIQIARGVEETLTLGNINIIRDWGYAPLYVEAMWRMLQQDKMDDFLICSGIPVSLESFVKKVFQYFNIMPEKHIVIDPALMRSLDLDVIYGDNSKAKVELGWHYDLTPDDLIARLVQDEQNFMAWEEQKIR